MKHLFKTTLLVTAAIIAFASCKKKESSLSTEASNLTSGKWKYTKVTIDLNNNSTRDTGDWVLTDSAWANEYQQFSTNGTSSYYIGGTVSSTGTWQLVNNNTYLKTDTTGGTKPGYYKIETLTSSNLVLKDTAVFANGAVSWLEMAK
jgi:hypothetical protein